MGERLNKAYTNNLVYKDSYKAGKGGPTVCSIYSHLCRSARAANPKRRGMDGSCTHPRSSMLPLQVVPRPTFSLAGVPRSDPTRGSQPSCTVWSTTSQTFAVPRRSCSLPPQHWETRLNPVVRPGEEPKYISGQLFGSMARKWCQREGTLAEAQAILEEEKIRVTRRKTQDDVVRGVVAV